MNRIRPHSRRAWESPVTKRRSRLTNGEHADPGRQNEATIAMSLKLALDALDRLTETGVHPRRPPPAPRRQSYFPQAAQDATDATPYRSFRIARPLRELRRVLSVLSVRAQQSDLSPPALCRYDAGVDRGRRGARRAHSVAPVARACCGLWVRMGRPLRFRKESPRDVLSIRSTVWRPISFSSATSSPGASLSDSAHERLAQMQFDRVFTSERRTMLRSPDASGSLM